jgi:uncharacterized surface protein with fasciclin (FAS1) repeats
VSTAGLFTIGVLVTLIVAAAMALLIYAAILDSRDAAARRTPDREPPAPRRAVSILQTARAAGSLGTLVTAIDRAGLSDVLEHEGPYTVFAPSDEAFARLPDGAVQSLLAATDTLADVVNYHLVPGRTTAADVAGRISAETVQGEDLAISNHGVIRIDGARLVSGDLEASNGVIHVIDRVLLPARI